MTTEAKAKERRCCGPEGTGEFRPGHSKSPIAGARYCIAADCMAWRWIVRDPLEMTMLDMEAERLRGTPDEFDPKVPHGYCGLAGRG